MSRVSDKRRPFVELAWKKYNKSTITRAEVCELFNAPSRAATRKDCRVGDAVWPNWLLNDPQ